MHPFKDSKVFHSFMKNLIRDNITVKQVKRKLRDFKEKYEKRSDIHQNSRKENF
jgi:hypothetical protein